MFLFLFYAAKVRRKFKPRKKLFHPVTTLFHYATTLSTKHKKKRPPEGNLFLYYNTPHTLSNFQIPPHTLANFQIPPRILANFQIPPRILANFQSLTKFFYPSIQNSPTSLTRPTRLTRFRV